MHFRWIRYAAVLAGWTFLGFVLSIEVYFNARAHLGGGPVDFWAAAMPQFVRAAMWSLMAPLVLRLREKLPLSRGRWIGGVGFHLGMSFVVMATFYLGRVLSYVLFWREPFNEFWSTALNEFYGRNLIDMVFYWAVLGFGYSLEFHHRYKNEEVEFLERYLEIQKARFSDRLEIGIAIEPEAMEARIPNLLLQPLVENAILHGVAPKPGPGRVDVHGRVSDGKLHLEVRDDGPGLGDGAARAKEGIGLTNTRERIAKIYGARGHLSLRSESGRGVTVQIVLPCRT